MKKRRIAAIVMTIFMVISMLPASVFAEAVPAGALGGKLKLKGLPVVGTELSAKYEKAEPLGLTDDYVTFQWSRKDGETLTEVSTEKTYKPTEEDLGYPLVLKITGIADMGVTGELTVTTVNVCATEEEAKALEEAAKAAEEAEDALTEEVPGEEIPMEEIPMEEVPGEETPDASMEDVTEYYTEEPADSTDDLYTQDDGAPEDVIVIGGEDDGSGENDGNGEVQWTELESENPEEDLALLNQAAQQGGEEPQAGGEAPEDLTYSMEIISENGAVGDDGTPVVDFGTVTLSEGMTYPSQTLTIRNTGTGALNFTAISPVYFMVQDVQGALEPQGETTLWVQPREGQEPNAYEEVITYTTQEGAKASFTAKVVLEQEAPVETIDPAQIVADKTEVAFGELETGYQDTTSQILSITNNGTVDVELMVKEPYPQNFDLGELLPVPVKAGETASISIAPKAGQPAGEYSENLLIGDATGAVSFTIPMTYTVKDPQPDPVYTLTLTAPESQLLDFGTAEEGYAKVPEAQSVTVKNDGNQILTLQQPTSTAFTIGALSAVQIAPGETSSFTVMPKAGLEVKNHLEDIAITTDQGASAKVAAQFTVTTKTIKLLAVHKGADITGLTNGTKKTAEGLRLPGTVLIETTNGDMNAAVAWDVEGCAYSQGNKEAQTFQVNGMVTLPSGIENPDGLSLETTVKVSVLAEETMVPVEPTATPVPTATPIPTPTEAAKPPVQEREPIVPSEAATYITGIDPNGAYTTDSKLTFTAVGGGMDIAKPVNGDIRYVPLNWKVIEARAWDGAPYTATFRMNKAGDYTLTVTYNQQKYKDGEWKKTGEQITRAVGFSVKQSTTITATPTPVVREANRRKAVETGDYTQIVPYVAVLILAVACIAGVIVYRKKKR